MSVLNKCIKFDRTNFCSFCLTSTLISFTFVFIRQMFSTVADTVSTCGIISSQEKNTSAVHVLRSSCVSKFVTH